jgi:periplasmic protein TonB
MAESGGTPFAVAGLGRVRDNISTDLISSTMTETTSTAPERVNASAGHLSVHFEGAHPVDVPFLFEQPQKRIGPAFAASLASHAAIFLIGVLIVRYGNQLGHAAVMPPDNPNKNIVWLNQPGPGGGGGGGGNQMKEPPRQAELPGKEKITVPVQKPEAPKITKNEPDPVAQLVIPAKTMASAAESLPGAIDIPPGPPTLSQGSGTGGGAGTGSGTGIGPGRGSGLGDGWGGGTGGGAFQPGNGVTTPIVVKEVKPAYTSDAMRAKIQGAVLVECDVQPDGSVTNVKVVRSLDPTFGLDNEAVKAARQWRFKPGLRFGQPVPVTISIELTFTLR